jgi:hypothetical protein
MRWLSNERWSPHDGREAASHAGETMRRNDSRKLVVHARPARAEVRRPSLSPLARWRGRATDGHWECEGEGKIKGTAPVGPQGQIPSGPATAPADSGPCRRRLASSPLDIGIGCAMALLSTGWDSHASS